MNPLKLESVDLDNLSLQINCIRPPHSSYPLNLGWTEDYCPLQYIYIYIYIYITNKLKSLLSPLNGVNLIAQ